MMGDRAFNPHFLGSSNLNLKHDHNRNWAVSKCIYNMTYEQVFVRCTRYNYSL